MLLYYKNFLISRQSDKKTKILLCLPPCPPATLSVPEKTAGLLPASFQRGPIPPGDGRQYPRCKKPYQTQATRYIPYPVKQNHLSVFYAKSSLLSAAFSDVPIPLLARFPILRSAVYSSPARQITLPSNCVRIRSANPCSCTGKADALFSRRSFLSLFSVGCSFPPHHRKNNRSLSDSGCFRIVSKQLFLILVCTVHGA